MYNFVQVVQSGEAHYHHPMDSDQQTDEAAAQVIPGVTTGALLEAMENPDIFAEIARGDLYVQMAKMRQQAVNPEMPLNQRMEYMKMLSKMGKVDSPDKGADNPLAGVPTINIVLPGSGASVQLGGAPPPRVEKDITPQEVDHGFGSGTGKPSKAEIP